MAWWAILILWCRRHRGAALGHLDTALGHPRAHPARAILAHSHVCHAQANEYGNHGSYDDEDEDQYTVVGQPSRSGWR